MGSITLLGGKRCLKWIKVSTEMRYLYFVYLELKKYLSIFNSILGIFESNF